MEKSERLCWFCKHFDYSKALQGYSDLTPEIGFELHCWKHHWEFDPYKTTQEEFGKILTTARTCGDFVLLESLKGGSVNV